MTCSKCQQYTMNQGWWYNRNHTYSYTIENALIRNFKRLYLSNGWRFFKNLFRSFHFRPKWTTFVF